MRKLIKLYLLSILTGCSPVNQIGIVKESATTNNTKVNTTVNKSEVKPSVSVSVVATPIPTLSPVTPQKVIEDKKISDGLKNVMPIETVSPSPSQVPTVSPFPDVTIHSGNINSGPMIDKPRFSDPDNIDKTITINRDIMPKHVTKAEIQITFNDSVKARLTSYVKFQKGLLDEATYYSGRNKGLVEDFVSLNGDNLDQINNIFKKYKGGIDGTYDRIGTSTQSELDKIELENEAYYGVDVRNEASVYVIYLGNIQLNDFVEELRSSCLIKEVSWATKPSSN